MKRSLVLLAFTFACAACVREEKYASLAFELQSTPPVPVSVESDRIELVAGIAVKVAATPESSGHSYSSEDLLTLRADDAQIFEVYSTEDPRSFVFVGLHEGESCLEVRINSREEECIAVRVLPAED